MLAAHLIAVAATLVGTERWARLAQRLPTSLATASSPQAPLVTLYRDTNGWCPFCERVWLQLQAKGIPYEEVLINLRDKPQWYKDMVPTTLVKHCLRLATAPHVALSATIAPSHSRLFTPAGACRQAAPRSERH
jgi:hypothetical protein